MLWEEGQLSLCLLWFPGHSVEGKPMYSAHTEYTRYLPTASGVGSREAYKIWMDLLQENHVSQCTSVDTGGCAKLQKHFFSTQAGHTLMQRAFLLLPTCLSRQDPFWNGDCPSRPLEARRTDMGRAMRWGGEWRMEFYLPWLPERIATKVQRWGRKEELQSCIQNSD